METKDKMRGQAIVIVVLLLFVIAALIALVVDGGNAYAQRRRAQNAVDTAALSGAQELTKAGDPGVTHREVWTAIADYSEANGLSPMTDTESVDAWYIDDEGERVHEINDVPAQVNRHFWEREISGVEVQGALPFDTYFAQVLGLDSLTAHANAKAWILCGACAGSNLFPVAVSTDTFDLEGTWPYSMEVDFGHTHRIWERQDGPGSPAAYPGNFGWVNWDADPPRSPYPQGNGTPVLIDNIMGDDRSGLWWLWDLLAPTPGSPTQPVVDAVASRIGQTLVVPIYGAVKEKSGGAGLRYEIWGFGAFVLTCFHYHHQKDDIGTCQYPLDPDEEVDKDARWIEGYFVRIFEDLPNTGACPDLGLCTVKLRRPIDASAP